MGNSAASRARSELEKQLVELSRLRNANTRDSEFKVWRQATLTLIQRVWEGDDSRSSRFRSVPFSPGSSRADAKLTREWFERGCAEAARLLRDLIEEINEHGIIKGPAVVMDEPEALPEDEHVPILSLDGSESDGRPSAFADETDDMRLSFDDDDDDDDDDEDDEDDDDEFVMDEDDLEIPDIPDPPGARQPKPTSRPMPRSAARPEAPKPAPGKPAAPKLPAASEVKHRRRRPSRWWRRKLSRPPRPRRRRIRGARAMRRFRFPKPRRPARAEASRSRMAGEANSAARSLRSRTV